MGLLGKKQQCAACGKDLGLIKNKLSQDVFLCANCSIKVGNNIPKDVTGNIDVEALKNKVLEYDEKLKEKTKKFEEFTPTKKVGNFMSVDENKKQFWVSGGISTFKKIYDFSDVQGYELIEDGETVSKGGLGRAVVGGALFGSVGAVVGGVTGNKKTKSICSKMQIKITVKDMSNPVIYINLLNSETKKDSFTYKTFYNSAQEIISLLQLMIDANKDTQVQETTSNVSTADELKKYKDLLDSGAITEDEYNQVKSKLLGI